MPPFVFVDRVAFVFFTAAAYLWNSQNLKHMEIQEIKQVTLSDGRIVGMPPFQAKQFVKASQDFAKQGITDPLELTFGIMSELCDIWEGEGDRRRLTMADIDDMYQGDIAKIEGLMNVAIVVETEDGKGSVFGILPSGRGVKLRKPKGKDMRSSGQFGAENRIYSMIAACVEIDGKALEMHDAQLLDGWDFIAIQNFLN